MRTSNDLAIAGRILDETPPGFYGVRDIYGEEWDLVDHPQRTARLFREAVLADRLPRVRLDSPRPGLLGQ